MKRRTPARTALGATMLLVAATSGCAAFTGSGNESIIRVQSRVNPVKAQRLTLAGVAAMENGQLDYAFDKLIAAIEADESYGPAHNNIGLLHYDEGNLYPAILAFERAMELMPQNATAYYNLGLTLEAGGKLDQALDLYWQAHEMDPTEPHYLGNLVRLRVRMGENGPDVISQLQDLILIETRPDWKRWADKELALDLNMALDRGPETPNFNSSDSDDAPEEQKRERASRRVIDLTPEDQRVRSLESDETERRNSGRDDRLQSSEELPAPPSVESETNVLVPPQPHVPKRPISSDRSSLKDLRPSDRNPTVVDSKPIPIRSAGAFESLPPSIDLGPDTGLNQLLEQ